ncbi:hypothetical protein D9615_002844 [Tricholomella constricta]|uniref:Glycoside hydrolase family 71 protein n=1 Tax=Tricholomella constricta TaxID=117010 RepID=A0A8H5M6E8_9AGAR|nr:hypothetical protein D9615_002844 [Tricholomella constricta]
MCISAFLSTPGALNRLLAVPTMHFLSLFIHLFPFLLTVSAHVIPVRRIKISHHKNRQVPVAIEQARLLPNRPTYIEPAHLTVAPSIVSSAPPSMFSRSTLNNRGFGRLWRREEASNETDLDPPRKYVVAHHMVGNTYPYEFQDWVDDIALAHASGLDGFALNMGRDEWQLERVSDAYEAALQSGLDFKLFLSLDMSSMPSATSSDAQTLRNIVLKFVSHPNQLKKDLHAFVSTFAGESSTFGQGSVLEGWRNEFSGHPDLQGKIHFVPSFFIDPATFGTFRDVMDGDFNWNSGWPIHLTTDFVQNLLSSVSAPGKEPSLLSGLENLLGIDLSSMRVQNTLGQLIGSTDSDIQHLQNLAALSNSIRARNGKTKPTYMAAVSPWFFTHYGADTYNKNFVFLSDQHLYSKRWESLIATRDQIDIVQVLTWNDYGESHDIGPIKGAQPNSEAWVDGMDHTGWLELTRHYATAFKTGSFPNIETDKLFMWSRTHPTQANAPDPVGQPTNFELASSFHFEDAVWAVVMTTAPSTVVLSTSPTTSQTFEVPAGLSKLSIPITAGGKMQGTISRGGKAVVTLNAPQFTFQENPEVYNFNAFVASASASVE